MPRSRSFGPSLSSHPAPVLMLAFAYLLFPPLALATNVLIDTPLGEIEIELLEDDAPKTVANFLNYIDNGRYTNTFMHRSVPGFVSQGGGFIFVDGTADNVEAFPAVENEFGNSNIRGTVAMAKLGGDPDSATSQWFISVADNSDSLDGQNGGFTVFARVIGDGMDVVDAINALPTVNAGGAFGELPVINFPGGSVLEENLVMTAVSRKPSAGNSFIMNAGLNDAWFDPLTDGQGFFITVFPSLNFVSLAWFTYDTELPAVDTSANLGNPGHRWITAGGIVEGNRAVMNITVTSGGIFDAASGVQRTDPVGSDGVITLTFDDCSSGLIEYDITAIDQQGTVPIVRVAADNVSMCEALSEADEGK